MKFGSKSWRECGGAVVLILLVVGLFWPVLGYDFVRWDDDVSATSNPMLEQPWSWELVGSFFDPQAALRFKPLHWLALRLVHDGAGLNPAAWHALGLVFHAGAAAGVFMALSKALKMADIYRDAALVVGVAWLATAIWALHPLRVEPVAWVTGSSYPMTVLFLAWSYWAYLKAHDADGQKGEWGGWLGVSWLLAVAAYATYPISVTYVAWLMATDGFLLRKVPSQSWRIERAEVRAWWGKHVAFVLPAAAAVAATLWTRLVAPAGWFEAPSLGDVGWFERLTTAAATFMVFPAKLVWPVELTPNHAHSRESWSLVWVVVGAVAFGCVATLLWIARKRRPAWTWFFVGALGFALPCLGLTELPVWPVDRYSYALDVILIGGLAAACLVIAERAKQGWWVAGALVLVLGAVMVASRGLLPVWRNTDTLFAHMERHPSFGSSVVQKAHVYLLWHVQLMSEGRTEDAQAKLKMANETYFEAMRDALRRGNVDRAVVLSRALESNIGITPETRRERAGWLIGLGRTQEGRAELEQAARDLPGDARVEMLRQQLRLP